MEGRQKLNRVCFENLNLRSPIDSDGGEKLNIRLTIYIHFEPPRNDDSGELVVGRTTANSFHKNSVRLLSAECIRTVL